MLNSMDGYLRMPTPRKSARQSLAITAVFCMLGLASLATRGIAEPPEVQARPKSGPFKTISLVKPSADSLPKPTTDLTNGMFQHSPLDPGLGPNHPDGLMVIRVRELLERPEMRNYATALNGLVAQGLSHVLKSETVPEMSFESIEWIAATPSFSLSEQKDDPSERSHRLMIGTGGAVIRFHQPIDLAGWFERFCPNSQKSEFEGRTLYELELPFLGPQPCYLWQSDEKTLRSRVLIKEFPQAGRPSLDLVKQWIKSSETSVTANTTAWVPTWNRTDKGLISIVLCNADLSGVNEKFYEKCEREGSLAIAAGNLIRQLLPHGRSTAFLFDLAEGPTIGIRFSLLHDSGDSAKTSLKQFEDLADAVKVDLKNQHQKLDSSKGKDNDRMKYHLLKQAFGMRCASIQEHSDGTASLNISTVFPFFMIVEAMHSLD